MFKIIQDYIDFISLCGYSPSRNVYLFSLRIKEAALMKVLLQMIGLADNYAYRGSYDGSPRWYVLININ